VRVGVVGLEAEGLVVALDGGLVGELRVEGTAAIMWPRRGWGSGGWRVVAGQRGVGLRAGEGVVPGSAMVFQSKVERPRAHGVAGGFGRRVAEEIDGGTDELGFLFGVRHSDVKLPRLDPVVLGFGGVDEDRRGRTFRRGRRSRCDGMAPAAMALEREMQSISAISDG